MIEVLCIYIVGFFLVVKNSEIMKFEGKWREREDIILSDLIKFMKDKCSLFFFICGFFFVIFRCEYMIQSYLRNEKGLWLGVLQKDFWRGVYSVIGKYG